MLMEALVGLAEGTDSEIVKFLVQQFSSLCRLYSHFVIFGHRFNAMICLNSILSLLLYCAMNPVEMQENQPGT